MSISFFGGCQSDSESTSESMGGEDHSDHLGGEQMIYSFESKFIDHEDSTSYSGQIARHILINALKSQITDLTDRLESGFFPVEGSIVEQLNLFYDCVDDVCSGESVGVRTRIATHQNTIGDLSSGKNLNGKIAGNDSGQHKDWTTDLIGWGEDPITPEELVRSWFAQIEERSIAISNGDFLLTPSGEEIKKPYVTAEGLDLSQLTQKFLLGAVAFSQGTDDYLDDADEGRGILADNTAVVDGKPYTALEHNWDEGFGYFGAAQDYLSYTDDELAAKGGRDDYQGHHDSDGDGQIDLTSEFNWGHCLNAAKRDRGASTNFTEDAFMGFYRGRQLITSVDGALTQDQLNELKEYRDVVVSTWEKAIAATVVHYINDVLADMESGANYDFYNHAKHWSEMKGFALSLQFNPRTPLSTEQFSDLHRLLGLSPALPQSESFEGYKQGLLEARGLIENVYEFDTNDVESW